MKKIMLFCSQGMSTSMLVNAMKEAAEKENYECDISAHTQYDVETLGKKADCILLGPQIRFMKEKVSKDMAPIPVDFIDMRKYAMMDGKGVLHQAIDMMK